MVEYFIHTNLTGYNQTSVPYSIEMLKVKDGCFTSFQAFLEVPDGVIWEVEKPITENTITNAELFRILSTEVAADGPIYTYNAPLLNIYFRSIYGESVNRFLLGGSFISLMEIFRFRNPYERYSLARACEFYQIDYSNPLVALYFLKQKMAQM